MEPRWLQLLLSEKFFNACIIHQDSKKNEKNIYCLDCCTTFCPHCLSSHNSHRLLQIRRYVYHDVVRLDDVQKLVDCAYVQPYITNNAKVVFIKQRPQTRQCRGSGNICFTCDRTLQQPFLFCSLSCKIDYLIKTKTKLSMYLYECNFMPLPEPGLEDSLITPDSILEPEGSTQTFDSGQYGKEWCKTLACTASTTEIVRKKRSSVCVSTNKATCPSVWSSVTKISLRNTNRRKGTPHRSPLY